MNFAPLFILKNNSLSSLLVYILGLCLTAALELDTCVTAGGRNDHGCVILIGQSCSSSPYHFQLVVAQDPAQ